MSFPITCTACHKTFTISDEIFEKKVAGRVVTIKCKSCSQGIRVDGTKGGARVAPAAAPAAAAEAPAEAVAAGEPLWAVDYPDGQDREFTTAEVVTELERGTISGTTLVWRDGMPEWLELHQVPELGPELAKIEAKKQAVAVAAAKAAAAAAGPIHRPRAPMPTVTGLAGLPGAMPAAKPAPAEPASDAVTPRAAQASSLELPKARAQQPSSPLFAPPRAAQGSSPGLGKPRALQPSSPELPKPRAQQPSSPELPKPRAQQPSSPELPKPRAQQPSSPVLPKPPAPPPPLAAPTPAPIAASPPALTSPLPFAAPPPRQPAPDPLPEVTPPLPASVAKVVSRPPQAPPTFPMASPAAPPFAMAQALVADHASIEWPEAKKKTPLIVAGVIGAVVVIGGGIFAFSSKEEAQPASPISAVPPAPAAAPTPSPTSSPSPTTAAAAATQPGAETATGSDPIAAPRDPGATPGAGFAELFAAGARKAESKGATVASTARFDAAATKVPLAQAANDAQACKQSGGPTGKVTVVVTFDPNGKVSSATITEAPFAGTATGACIASALKRAAIAPFSGLPGTVSKTFSIL